MKTTFKIKFNIPTTTTIISFSEVLVYYYHYFCFECQVHCKTDLKFPVVELIAVFKQELVGGSKACFDTVFNHCAGPRWT
jgi:hypothetical protein